MPRGRQIDPLSRPSTLAYNQVGLWGMACPTRGNWAKGCFVFLPTTLSTPGLPKVGRIVGVDS